MWSWLCFQWIKYGMSQVGMAISEALWHYTKIQSVLISILLIQVQTIFYELYRWLTADDHWLNAWLSAGMIDSFLGLMHQHIYRTSQLGNVYTQREAFKTIQWWEFIRVLKIDKLCNLSTLGFIWHKVYSLYHCLHDTSCTMKAVDLITCACEIHNLCQFHGFPDVKLITWSNVFAYKFDF